MSERNHQWLSRRDLVRKAGAASMAALVGTTALDQATTTAVASTDAIDATDGGDSWCETYDPSYGRAEFRKASIGFNVEYVKKSDGFYSNGDDLYSFRSGVTATRSYYEQDSVWDDQKYTAEEFCSDQVRGQHLYEVLDTTIEVTNDNFELVTGDGDLSVGAAPHELLYSDTTQQNADYIETLFTGAVNFIPILGDVYTAATVASEFGSASNEPTTGDNKETWTWEFKNWSNADSSTDTTACNGFVDFGIRAPPDQEPEFTVDYSANQVGLDGVSVSRDLMVYGDQIF